MIAVARLRPFHRNTRALLTSAELRQLHQPLSGGPQFPYQLVGPSGSCIRGREVPSLRGEATSEAYADCAPCVPISCTHVAEASHFAVRLAVQRQLHPKDASQPPFVVSNLPSFQAKRRARSKSGAAAASRIIASRASFLLTVLSPAAMSGSAAAGARGFWTP
jgi:hypothetical protein